MPQKGFLDGKISAISVRSASGGNKHYAVVQDVVGSFTGSKGGRLTWKPAAYPNVLDHKFSNEDIAIDEQARLSSATVPELPPRDRHDRQRWLLGFVSQPKLASTFATFAERKATIKTRNTSRLALIWLPSTHCC